MDVSALQVAYATRYLEAVGITVLFYDHLLTFADEVAFIWTAPASTAKYSCLMNRYLVLATLIALSLEVCGFVGNLLDNARFLFVCSMLAIFSVGLANTLVLSRVVLLWENRPAILRVMTIGFAVSFGAQVITMIFTLLDFIPTVEWSPIAGMCIVQKASPLYIAVWASPMLFEVLVLLMTSLNALDRPRSADTPIRRTLYRDGIGYFLSISSLRVFNITAAALQNPAYTLLGVFFVWAMTTTILNRLLINLRREEQRAIDNPSEWRPISPFSRLSSITSKLRFPERSASPEERVDETGLTSFLPQTAYHYQTRTRMHNFGRAHLKLATSSYYRGS